MKRYILEFSHFSMVEEQPVFRIKLKSFWGWDYLGNEAYTETKGNSVIETLHRIDRENASRMKECAK